MITRFTHPFGSIVKSMTNVNGLKIDKDYVVDGWMGDRVIVLVDREKRWFKANNFK